MLDLRLSRLKDPAFGFLATLEKARCTMDELGCDDSRAFLRRRLSPYFEDE